MNQTKNQKTEFQIPEAQSGQKIGLFGGSFNPPHDGHLLVAQTAIERLQLDALWWIITPGNPIKDKSALSPLEDRIAASQKLIESATLQHNVHLNNKIHITAFEVSLKTIYSSDVIDILYQRDLSVYFTWIIGADNLASFHHWHKWRKICEMIPIAVINRPDAEEAALSSPFATTYETSRIDEKQASLLSQMKPPAWVFIHGPLSNSSSTIMRQQNKHKSANKEHC